MRRRHRRRRRGRRRRRRRRCPSRRPHRRIPAGPTTRLHAKKSKFRQSQKTGKSTQIKPSQFPQKLPLLPSDPNVRKTPRPLFLSLYPTFSLQNRYFRCQYKWFWRGSNANFGAKLSTIEGSVSELAPAATELAGIGLGLSARGHLTLFIATHVCIRTSDTSTTHYQIASQAYGTLRYRVIVRSHPKLRCVS